eukprot:m51a1_g2192 hypothetical protein (593) ;mRNA; f:126872-128885
MSLENLMAWAAGSHPDCRVCGKLAYPAERVRVDSGVVHRACLRCSVCGRLLPPNLFRTIDHSVFYCAVHYAQAAEGKNSVVAQPAPPAAAVREPLESPSSAPARAQHRWEGGEEEGQHNEAAVSLPPERTQQAAGSDSEGDAAQHEAAGGRGPAEDPSALCSATNGTAQPAAGQQAQERPGATEEQPPAAQERPRAAQDDEAAEAEAQRAAANAERVRRIVERQSQRERAMAAKAALPPARPAPERSSAGWSRTGGSWTRQSLREDERLPAARHEAEARDRGLPTGSQWARTAVGWSRGSDPVAPAYRMPATPSMLPSWLYAELAVGVSLRSPSREDFVAAAACLRALFLQYYTDKGQIQKLMLADVGFAVSVLSSPGVSADISAILEVRALLRAAVSRARELVERRAAVPLPVVAEQRALADLTLWLAAACALSPAAAVVDDVTDGHMDLASCDDSTVEAVASFLDDPGDVASLASTCRRLHVICSRETLYERIARRRAPAEEFAWAAPSGGWRAWVRQNVWAAGSVWWREPSGLLRCRACDEFYWAYANGTGACRRSQSRRHEGRPVRPATVAAEVLTRRVPVVSSVILG